MSRLRSLVPFLVTALPMVSAAPPMPDRAAVDDDLWRRAGQLVKELTLEEKVSLCRGNSTMTLNAIPKIGLSEEWVMSDGPHTVRPDLERETFDQANTPDDHSTNLPALSTLAATWDPELARKFGNVLGRECRDRGKDMLLGPGVNLMRTPLCGRNFEYMHEDPCLNAAMAVEYIRGVQEMDVAACVKHFAVNTQEWNRYEVDSRVSERALRELYLPAFEAAVKRAGVHTVMSGYNRFRGEHCSHNFHLNQRILKMEWGFPGLVVTDWGGLHDTVKGALGGTDVEMNSGDAIRYFKEPLVEAVRKQEVPEEVVEDKAQRVLYVMLKTGKIGERERAKGARNTKEHQEFAREVAEKAIVLLKNDDQVLPLAQDKVRKLLVLGANADRKHCHLGWSAEGKPPYEITPLEGLKKLLGESVEMEFRPLVTGGLGVEQIPESCLLTQDTTAKDQGMRIKAWKAAYFDNKELKGDPVWTGFDRKLDFRWNTDPRPPGIGEDNFSARWTAEVRAPETGEYLFGISNDDGARVFLDDKLVVDSWTNGAERQTTATVKLEEGRKYTIRAEYFEDWGDAVFSFGWRLLHAEGAVTTEDLAKEADAVLIFTGNQHGHGQAMEMEGADRPNLKLPAGHDEAIAKLLPLNAKTVVINLSGAPVEMPWVENAHSLVQYWFAGQEGGNALARVLFGEVNPSGKLPCTFPVSLEESAVPSLDGEVADHVEGIYIGYRWFQREKVEPLFAFGHGLSYTTFELSQPRVSKDEIEKGESITATVTVRNTGKVAGAEVVQFYLQDVEASVDRPARELKGFGKVHLEPGEEREVTATFSPRDLSFWDEKTKGWKAEPGAFKVHTGNASDKITGSVGFVLGD